MAEIDAQAASFLEDAAAGTLVWSYVFSHVFFYVTPAFANGVLYVASEDGYVYAFNASNGSLVWQANVGPSISSPLVVGGAVIVGTAAGMVDKLRTSDGHLMWSTNVGGAIWSPASIAGGVVYVGASNGNVDPTVYVIHDHDANARGKVREDNSGGAPVRP